MARLEFSDPSGRKTGELLSLRGNLLSLVAQKTRSGLVRGVRMV